MRYLVLLLLLACDERSVEIFGPAGTKIDVTTRRQPGQACEVTATIVVPQISIPVLVPMPMPYTPLAEKP